MKKLILIVVSILFFLAGCNNLSTPQVTYILNPGKDTIAIGESWVDAGINIKYGVKILDVVVKTNTINEDVPGTYEVIYEAIYNNKTINFTRYVFVVDRTAPVLTLNEGIDTINLGSEWTDNGVTAIDNFDDDISVIVIGEVDTQLEGQYIITYKAMDAYGNISYIQ